MILVENTSLTAQKHSCLIGEMFSGIYDLRHIRPTGNELPRGQIVMNRRGSIA